MRGGGVVMICDIDNVKQVNDRSGHLTGDLVLSEVARILSHHGFAGRLGGDELVLHADVPRRGSRCARRTHPGTGSRAFPPGSIDGWEAGVSIGIAIASPDQQDISALVGCRRRRFLPERAARWPFAIH